MSLIEIFRVVQFVYILPSAAGEGFHIGREADVFEK